MLRELARALHCAARMNTTKIVLTGLSLLLGAALMACGGPEPNAERAEATTNLSRSQWDGEISRDDLEGWGYTCETVSIGWVRCTKCYHKGTKDENCVSFDCPSHDRHADCEKITESGSSTTDRFGRSAAGTDPLTVGR